MLSDINEILINCQICPRLVEWRKHVGMVKRKAFRGQEYWSKPVPGFGDTRGSVFVVGLAPGAHGSNRTGRQFTGDSSGDFLFPALFRAGFASQPTSTSNDDGLTLCDMYISAVCRCVPPGNKPSTEEILNCQTYLEQEILIVQPKIFVALGRIAFGALVRILMNENGDSRTRPTMIENFGHNVFHQIPGNRYLVTSYHPSRQNTQTGKLTVPMFDSIWNTVRNLISDGFRE